MNKSVEIETALMDRDRDRLAQLAVSSLGLLSDEVNGGQGWLTDL